MEGCYNEITEKYYLFWNGSIAAGTVDEGRCVVAYNGVFGDA